MGINRAMFVGAFGFVAGGAAATVDGWVAIDLLEQGIPAIGYAALDHPERAAFADCGAGFPMGMDLDRADVSKSCGGEFSDGFQEEASDAGCRC